MGSEWVLQLIVLLLVHRRTEISDEGARSRSRIRLAVLRVFRSRFLTRLTLHPRRDLFATIFRLPSIFSDPHDKKAHAGSSPTLPPTTPTRLSLSAASTARHHHHHRNAFSAESTGRDDPRRSLPRRRRSSSAAAPGGRVAQALSASSVAGEGGGAGGGASAVKEREESAGKKGRTQRIMEAMPSSQQAMGAGGSSTYQVGKENRRRRPRFLRSSNPPTPPGSPSPRLRWYLPHYQSLHSQTNHRRTRICSMPRTPPWPSPYVLREGVATNERSGAPCCDSFDVSRQSLVAWGTEGTTQFHVPIGNHPVLTCQ